MRSPPHNRMLWPVSCSCAASAMTWASERGSTAGPRTCAGPPHGLERNPLGATERCTMARPAGAVWTMVDCREPMPAWSAAGGWPRVLEELQREADADGKLDWGPHHVDGTVVRAHQHAAGAAGGQQQEALERSRGGFSTKIRLRAEGGARPNAFVPSGGERHESPYLQPLLGQVACGGPGRAVLGRGPRAWSETRVTAIQQCDGFSHGEASRE
jgi:hypothetical protein